MEGLVGQIFRSFVWPLPGVKGKNMQAYKDKGRPTAFQADDRGVRLSMPAPVSITINFYRFDSHAVVAEMD